MNCKAILENDKLFLETEKIRRVYRFNNGHLISEFIEDKVSGKNWEQDVKAGFRLGWAGNDIETDFALPLGNAQPEHKGFEVIEVPETQYSSEYMLVKVIFALGRVEVMREFKLYPKSSAVSCTFYLRGSTADATWLEKKEADINTPIESASDVADFVFPAPMLDKFYYTHTHQRCKCIQFFDVTDTNNNLVKTDDFLPYISSSYHSGNLMMSWELINQDGFFILKEAPTSEIQMSSPGFDFIADNRHISVVGLGIQPSDLKENEWVRAYGIVTGVASGGEEGLTRALREHQVCARKFDAKRDSMLLLNTWGDRSQDMSLSEEFALREMELAAKLGITHFQLDAGWQTESFSTLFSREFDKRTQIWEPKDVWQIHEERFPNGFEPLLAKAEELNIELCLWFVPCPAYDYKNWEKDADVLLDLYKKYNIRIFKIDGVLIFSRAGELNLRRFLDKVKAGTDNFAVFNLDTTAGKRFGYNYFNEYGNYFIENRYTDWGNYYPHWVLRNLWQLSEYIQPQFMQFEFLNNLRNPQIYNENDIFAPYNIPFEYCFAITMASQPLAWFETANLPEEAFEISSVIKIYLEHQSAFHCGRIFPIGDEPSGTSWTGFQSIDKGKGYFLVFREYNENKQLALKVRELAGKKLKCISLCGSGKDFTAVVSKENTVMFELPEHFSYALFKYQCI